MADLNERLLSLASSFKRFNFPTAAGETGDSKGRAYVNAVSTLHDLNPKKLDDLVEESLELYQFQRDFDLNDGTGSNDVYLSDFTKKLQATSEGEIASFASFFEESQIGFSQSDSEVEGIISVFCASDNSNWA
jgi:hypothetical protein